MQQIDKTTETKGNDGMKKREKILSLLLAVCMIVTLSTFISHADSSVPDTKWDDYAAAEFAGGTGTKDDPYLIKTAEQLAKLSKDVFARNTHRGEYFRLEEDIDLSAHRWIPIGDYGGKSYDSFEGFLDGNGKTITGMAVDQSKDNRSAGLFGHISNATAGNEVGVKDLTIANAALYIDEEGTSDVTAGILVAGAMVNDGYKGTGVFENISVSGTITVKATDGYNKIGGLIGDDSRCIVRNCTTDVTITGASNAGGMTGVSGNTVFENCTAKGKISGWWAVGGFVGYATSSDWDEKTTESTFTNCIADVTVEASDWNVGGFVGLAEFGTFKNSASFGNVTSTVTDWEARAGGFVGCAGDTEYYESSNVTFINCHSASLVTCGEEKTRGGFAGKFVAGTADGCSFDSKKNTNRQGIGTNETEQQVKACTTQETLFNICVDVYERHLYAEESTVDQKPTCTEDGFQSQHCIRCDATGEKMPIPANGHRWNSDYTVDKEPTCTENGSKSIHCSVCTATTDEQVIKATGHTASDWKSDDTKHWKECTVVGCGAIIDNSKAAHTAGDWITDTAATATAAGTKHKECTVCHRVLETAAIPMTDTTAEGETSTGKTDPSTTATTSPKTGDNSMTRFWGILLFVSGTGLAGAAVYRKRKKAD